MPRDWSPAEYRIVRARIEARDGGECTAGLWGIDGEATCPFVGEPTRKQVDHVRERDECTREEYVAEGNLRLLCQSCNVKKEHRRRARLRELGVMSKLSTQRVCVREEEEEYGSAEPLGGSLPSRISNHVGSEEQGPHLRKNHLMEPVYREFVLSTVLKSRLKDPPVEHSKKSLNDAGAEACQGNPATTVRYLDKLVNEHNGLLEVVGDGYGGLLVRLREKPHE